MKRKEIAGVVGRFCGARVDLDGVNIPVVKYPGTDLIDCPVAANKFNASWIVESDKRMMEGISLLRNAVRIRNEAEEELAKLVAECIYAYRCDNNIGLFNPEDFILCRNVDESRFSWVESIATGEKACEWRWHVLRREDGIANLSFEFIDLVNKKS